MAKVIHTADWHLGARLIDQDRREEHALFLSWLLETMKREAVELLIVAGDIFDSVNPPQSALSQYYQFLGRVIAETSSEVVIVGGNHDSGALLDAPKSILKSMRVHVVGSMPENTADCVFVFPNAVVAALPFLRERDVRQASAGLQYDEIAEHIRQGIGRRYQEALKASLELRGAQEKPILATAHLTAIGVSFSGSERDIHIGNLGAIEASCFEGFDYVALGHIHRPQKLGNSEVWRYSGSPITMNFDEIKYEKQVVLLEIKGKMVTPTVVEIPCFRRLLRWSGSAERFESYLDEALTADASRLPAWIEVTLPVSECSSERQQALRDAASKRGMRVLKILSAPVVHEASSYVVQTQKLGELQPMDVFKQLLQRNSNPDQVALLEGTFAELLSRMEETTQA